MPEFSPRASLRGDGRVKRLDDGVLEASPNEWPYTNDNNTNAEAEDVGPQTTDLRLKHLVSRGGTSPEVQLGDFARDPPSDEVNHHANAPDNNHHLAEVSLDGDYSPLSMNKMGSWCPSAEYNLLQLQTGAGPPLLDDHTSLHFAKNELQSRKRTLEQLVKLQLHEQDQAPKAAYVLCGGVWGFCVPQFSIRCEHPRTFFSSVKQRGVLAVPDFSIHNNYDEFDTRRRPNDDVEEVKKYPALFTWMHGGSKVHLTGSFTDWSLNQAIPMIKTQGRHFACLVYLPREIHRYKFIVTTTDSVDDRIWHFCPKQIQEVDRRGNVNNVLDMSKFDADMLNQISGYQQVYGTYRVHEGTWNQRLPDRNEMIADCSLSTPILLEAMSGIPLMLHDVSGYSTVLQHAILRTHKGIGKEDHGADICNGDVIASSIAFACEHSNTGSPDPRLTTLNFYSRSEDPIPEANSKPNLPPMLFDAPDTTDPEGQRRIILGQWTTL